MTEEKIIKEMKSMTFLGSVDFDFAIEYEGNKAWFQTTKGIAVEIFESEGLINIIF